MSTAEEIEKIIKEIEKIIKEIKESDPTLSSLPAMFDANYDEELDQDELSRAINLLTEQAYNQSSCDAAASEMMKRLDTDGNGKISLSELQSYFGYSDNPE